MIATPTPPLSIIQVISDESVPNILPVIALEPERVQWLISQSFAESGKKENLEASLKQLGLDPDFSEEHLDDMPTIRDTGKACNQLIITNQADGYDTVINFTGGTKLMGVGLYASALQSKTPSLYVDTAHHKFVDGETGEWPAMSPNPATEDFDRHGKRLNVNALAVSHGVERVTGGQNWKRLLPLAKAIFEQAEVRRMCWENFYGQNGIQAGGRRLRKDQMLEILESEVPVPHELKNLAVTCGVVEENEGSLRFPDHEETRDAVQRAPNAFKARIAFAPAQATITFFTGGWWEIIIADAMKRSGQFRDIRWSCEVGQRATGASLEEDILAIRDVQLAYVSCKLGFGRERILASLEEIATRAQKIGGKFTASYYCVFNPPPRNVYERAKQLKITVLTGSDFQNNATPFA